MGRQASGIVGMRLHGADTSNNAANTQTPLQGRLRDRRLNVQAVGETRWNRIDGMIVYACVTGVYFESAVALPFQVGLASEDPVAKRQKTLVADLKSAPTSVFGSVPTSIARHQASGQTITLSRK